MTKTKLRLLVAESSESASTIDAPACSPTTTIHAPQDVTVVLTVAVDGARLARSVAIRWHHTRKVRSRSIFCRDRWQNVLLTG
jgi:formate-dependent nitrite reductase cytochrome c552 subunit